MKLIYGGVPYNTTKVNHYEVPTNDCDMIASDLQAGKTAVARGQKIVGTGKSFEFAYYGNFEANDFAIVPNAINIIYVSSMEYPIEQIISLSDMKNLDFSTAQTIANLVADETRYPITVECIDNMLNIYCDKDGYFEIFYGKDNYI